MEVVSINNKKMNIVPQLRFTEFTGEWAHMKLGKLALFLGGGTPSTSNRQFWSGDIPWISSSDLTEDNIYSINCQRFITQNAVKQSATKIVPPKSILIVSRVGVGKVAVNEMELCTSQDYSNLVLNDAHYIFMAYLIKIKTKRFIEFNQGTSIKGFVKSDLESLKLNIPALPEQQKIASFLSAVDQKIQQLTCKKELLEQYKKGVMQKLFSREIRFKDENGKDYPNWEEKRLDSIILQFIVPMRDKPKDLTGLIPWCRIEDFVGKYLHGSKSGQGVSEETVKEMNLKKYPVNTLLVSCSANLGFCAIIKKELITNQTFIGLVPDKEKVDVEFLFYTMRLSSHRLNTLSSGTTISYLSREEFEKFKIQLPSLTEQNTISKFISVLDKKIEIVQTEITQTQQFKKGLLQQMFV